MIIRLKVFEQTLSIVEKKSVPRKGSKDYLALQFTFSSDWKDLDKLCYLQHGEVSQPIDVVDGIVEVPAWFTEQDSFDVTLFGKSGSQEVPTNVVSLRLEKSNTLWEQDAPEPQPSWLAKVIDLNNHPPIPGDNGYWMLWDTDRGAYVESELPLPAGGGGTGGTSDHRALYNRDKADQHPMSAVTGLVEALDGKQPTGDYLTQDNLQSATNAALEQAKASGEFDGADGADGGYYTPSVTQPDANTMRMSFSPSKEGMTAVSETYITLPSGGSGSVAVDSTLTVSGQAADAKAVGDAINRVNSAIEAKQDHLTEHGKQEIVLTGMTTGASWKDTEKQKAWGKLAMIKPELFDGIAIAGAQYYLGERKTVSIVLPDNAGIGQMITVSWYNGETAATLSITGTMLSFDYTPSANTRSEINALWDGTYWAVLGNEMAVPSEVTA